MPMTSLMWMKVAANKNKKCSYTRMKKSQSCVNAYTAGRAAAMPTVSASTGNHDSVPVRTTHPPDTRPTCTTAAAAA